MTPVFESCEDGMLNVKVEIEGKPALGEVRSAAIRSTSCVRPPGSRTAFPMCRLRDVVSHDFLQRLHRGSEDSVLNLRVS